MSKLKSEINTPEMAARVWDAFHASRVRDGHGDEDNGDFDIHFEHGQWWVTCKCGAAWSVVDAEGGASADGFDFEQVSEGDEDYHER